MNKTEAKKIIDKLKKEIDYHRYLYHVLDKQEISDAALDSLKNNLFKLEQQFPELITKDSPTQRVGGKPLDKFNKFNHQTRMISLFDAFSVNDMQEWEDRIIKILVENREDRNRLDYFVEVKLDGLAMSLNYKNKLFIAGGTRGNGRVGEDVTNNLKMINSIPLSLRKPTKEELINIGLTKVEAETILKSVDNGEVNVRGEVIITKKDFLKLNEKLKNEGKNELANARNGVAGSIRQLNPEITKERNLSLYAYEIIISNFNFRKHETKREVLKLLGFKVIKDNTYCKNLKQVFDFYHKIIKKRDSLPFEIDGLVVKVNEMKFWDILGIVGKGPRYMMAYKFPAEQTTTKIKEVIWQIGRTGVLTPTAIFEPIEIGGVTVSRATLHNMDEINRLELMIGDTVIIERAGDVIPKVIKVLKNLRGGEEEKINVPQKCSMCGQGVEQIAGEVAYRCVNEECYAVNLRRLMHWVSKGALDIEGLGGKIVEQLMQIGLVEDISDFYSLTIGDLIPLERFAEKSADNLINSITEKKIIDISRFIFGLGIRHIGEETSLVLAKKFLEDNKIKENRVIELDELIKYFQSLELEKLKNIQDIGPIVAESIIDWWNNKKNINIVEKLLEYGVKLKIDTRLKSVINSENNIFNNKIFVLTGSLIELTRGEAKDRIREYGGNVASAVSKKIDYVVVGDNPGSKYEKAKKLGLEIITEKEFIKMFKNNIN